MKKFHFWNYSVESQANSRQLNEKCGFDDFNLHFKLCDESKHVYQSRSLQSEKINSSEHVTFFDIIITENM